MQSGVERPLLDDDGRNANTLFWVARAMLRQVSREFAFSLQDLRVITEAELRFYYDIIRPDLKKAAKRK